jgi:hypothetical protein
MGSRRREEAENVEARSIRLLTSAATIVGEKYRAARGRIFIGSVG